MDVNIILNGDNNSLNVLKLCILYFDNVIVNDIKYMNIDINRKEKIINFIPNSFLGEDLCNQIYYLQKSNIIQIKDVILDKEHNNFVAPASKIIENVSNEMFEHIKIKDNSIRFLDDSKVNIMELNEIFDSLSEQQISNFIKYIFTDEVKVGENIDKEFLKGVYSISWYIEILNVLFMNIFHGENIITNSDFLNKLVPLQNSIDSSIKNSSILLPNLSNATFDDILYIKDKANDELLELKYYINSMSKDLNENNINSKINHSIKNFEYKMKDIKINTVQKFLTEIKNPFSYAPLLGTFVSNVPAFITMLISLGLITATTSLEYIKQLNNAKKDDMFFLLKLRKMIP